MKKLITLAASVILLSAAYNANAQNGFTSYGKEFKMENVHTMKSFEKAMEGKDKLENIALEGTISEVCQAEGCWVRLKNANGENIFVKFKDHGFVVPKNLAGAPMIVYGDAVRKTVTVDQQRHLAEDAGKSKDEIAKIVTPKQEVRFEATGAKVLVRE